ncbi:hypothetical protein GEMRC1_012767 [Eukaryota sp. GEM-RC1]
MEIRAIISEDHRLNPEVAEEHDSDDEDCQGPQVKDLIHEFSYDGSNDSIVSVSMEFCSSLGCQGDTYLFTWGCNELYIQDCSISGFSSETLMLINLIEFLKAMRPQLLIGYNCDKFTFPFLISRCNHLMIDVNFQFDGYTPYGPRWFKRWCKTSSFGPFHCLDLNSVLKSLYKFKGGRFLGSTRCWIYFEQKRITHLNINKLKKHFCVSLMLQLNQVDKLALFFNDSRTDNMKSSTIIQTFKVNFGVNLNFLPLFNKKRGLCSVSEINAFAEVNN